jgi:hypothetical protein
MGFSVSRIPRVTPRRFLIVAAVVFTLGACVFSFIAPVPWPIAAAGVLVLVFGLVTFLALLSGFTQLSMSSKSPPIQFELQSQFGMKQFWSRHDSEMGRKRLLPRFSRASSTDTITSK